MIPNSLPVLAPGAHTDPSKGACVMEYVSLLAGEEWSDGPFCTHPVLASMARVVNDRLPDDQRQELVPLIGRLFGTADQGGHEGHVLSVRLAAWCARQVLHLAPNRAASLAAIEAAEGWCDGTVTAQECRTYASAASASAASAASAAAAASAASASAASAANAAYAADAAANAAYAADAADAAYAADAPLVGLLTGLLDEYDRLTGRVEIPDVDPPAVEALRLAAATH